uniref:FAD-binding PCMH-type domain-containing protein n=1 Tax=Chenopodium quinoa TaxID=63459 RepID=A0A803MDN0_CHEQI
MQLDSGKYSWYTPLSIEELQNKLELSETNYLNRVKLVVSNTGTGYYKELEGYDTYIDLRYIPELFMITRDSESIQIGAAVSISKAIVTLEEGGKDRLSGGSIAMLKKIAAHFEKIASGTIRNSASIGGNLVMAQRFGFPSDIATVLLAVDSSVEMIRSSKRETINLEEFLVRPPLDSKSIIVSVKIPIWESSLKSNCKVLFDTYRAAPRPLGSALAYLNAAFLAEVSPNKSSDGFMVNKIHLAFGAYGTSHAVRVRKAEEFLAGRDINHEALRKTMNLIRATVVPEDGISHPSYRISLAEAFVFEFLHSLVEAKIGFSSLGLDQNIGSQSTTNCGVNQYSKQPLLLPAKQVIVPSLEYHPVGKPIGKVGAALQASGEATYVDDIPSPKDCLYGAFVYSTKPLARVNCVRYESESFPDGVVAVVSYKDIPHGGKNVGAQTNHGNDLLFADDLTRYAGERIALVVADTQRHADIAATKAVVDYDLENLEPPILTVEEAVERSSFFDIPPFMCPKSVGDFAKGMAEADQKILSAEVASACALAAYKLRRPVRMYLNRKTDMIMAGGRHPMKITYNVGFKLDGKITALHLEILVNAGISKDISPEMPENIVNGLNKYDWGALSLDIKLCKTNHTSKSSMRAPGELQGAFIAKAVIEHVASTLSIDVDVVRDQNFHTFDSLTLFRQGAAGEPGEYTLPTIWDKIASSSSFNHINEMVKQFNSTNIWRKKGISRLPIVHSVSQRSTPGRVSILRDGSIAVEVGGIELGQGLWTKVKQMAAFSLSLINCAGSDDLLDKVRVIQADTLSVVQGGYTSGSTTSESSCEAVRICCNTLVERLTPLKESLQEKMGSINWETLIFQAGLQSVNLSAGTLYKPDMTSMQYLNYGAAVSEVEVNLLTGETTILRSDIIYDCGQSLNPAVDLGQIEGAFVQGIGFFMLEEYLTDLDGLVVSDSTWTYKIPTIDTVPKQLNVEILNSGHHQKRVLSSKASGEPPLLLAASVHCATRAAIKEARRQLASWGGHVYASLFQLPVPATMPVVKELCGLDIVERYLSSSPANKVTDKQ